MNLSQFETLVQGKLPSELVKLAYRLADENQLELSGDIFEYVGVASAYEAHASFSAAGLVEHAQRYADLIKRRNLRQASEPCPDRATVVDQHGVVNDFRFFKALRA